jgi:hypothetical protein
MGLDSFALAFLAYSRKHGCLGHVATLGRQHTHVPPDLIMEILNMPQLQAENLARHTFCEQILKDGLGAQSVDSFDASNYENASFVLDINDSLPPKFENVLFDSVIDIGCLEHIFNVPQALANISNLCRVDGQILHILPANNCLGHGFWQFSPEMFFSYYSTSNGYDDTEVFLVETDNPLRWFCWYHASKPHSGSRLELTDLRCNSSLYIMVRTTKKCTSPPIKIQQSDYVAKWISKPILQQENHKKVKLSPLSLAVKKMRVLAFLITKFLKRNKLLLKPRRPWNTHSCLTYVDARSLLKVSH